MPRLKERIVPALLASVLAIAIVPIVASLVMSARQWLYMGEAWWSAPAQAFGGHEPLVWAVAGLGSSALLAYLLVRFADRSAVRLALGVWGLGQVAFGALAAFEWSAQRSNIAASPPSFPTLDLVAFGAAALASVVVAAGLVRTASRRDAKFAAVIAVLCTATAHVGSIARSIEDACPQELPAFEIRMVGARPVYPNEIVAPEALVVELEGQRYVLDEDDTLLLSNTDVRRIRWEPEAERDGFTLVLQDDAAAQLRERSVRRMDRHDALYLDGELVSIPIFGDVLLVGSFNYNGAREDGQVRDLYRRLSGRQP